MVRVEVTLSCLGDINFEQRKTFTWDQGDWDEMSPDEREAAIIEEAERFKNDTVEWDYKVL